MRQTKTLSPPRFIALGHESLQVAASPCWELALPDVISSIFLWVLGPVPRRASPVLLLVSSRTTSASPQSKQVRRAGTSHHHSNFYDGHLFRGCSHSLMFRLPYLLGLQVAPTSIAPQAIGQPGRLHHAMDVWLPSTNCGIATYPNRAIGMTGLSPARLRPCRPLHQTPVVSCALATAHPGLLPSGH